MGNQWCTTRMDRVRQERCPYLAKESGLETRLYDRADAFDRIPPCGSFAIGWLFTRSLRSGMRLTSAKAYRTRLCYRTSLPDCFVGAGKRTWRSHRGNLELHSMHGVWKWISEQSAILWRWRIEPTLWQRLPWGRFLYREGGFVDRLPVQLCRSERYQSPRGDLDRTSCSVSLFGGGRLSNCHQARRPGVQSNAPSQSPKAPLARVACEPN